MTQKHAPGHASGEHTDNNLPSNASASNASDAQPPDAQTRSAQTAGKPGVNSATRADTQDVPLDTTQSSVQAKPSTTDVYVILNPASGRGSTGGHQAKIVHALTGARLSHTLVETTYPNHAVELACAARQAGHPIIAAVGGDGTVSEVVNGLYRGTPGGEPVQTLAMFPTGSGNDFVEMLGAAKDPATIAARIRGDHAREIDLGAVTYRADGRQETRVFDNNLGLGFEAQVTLESYKIRRLKGTLLYVWAALRALRSYAAPRVTVEWEDGQGQMHTRKLIALMVTIGNSPRTGGGFYLTPNAQLDDGLLDLAIARHLPRWRILGLLPKALFGKHTNDPAVEMMTCRRAHITCHDPVPMHLDGEVVSRAVTEVELHVEPGRLRVIV